MADVFRSAIGEAINRVDVFTVFADTLIET